jgi:hypothetical protein
MTDEEPEGESEADVTPARIDRDNLRCSFCGQAYSEVETMVCGPTPTVAICNECVELCTEIMAEQPGGPPQAA